MINKNQKNIRACSIIALILCVIWTVINVLYFIGLLTGKSGMTEKVDWSENNSIKIVYFILYLSSTVMMIVLCFKVIINVLKGLREQVVFPQNNVKPLLWLASVSFIYMLCWMNQPILRGVISIHMQGANFILPFLLLFFAFMYKVAADAVEENNLTI